ncbi:MAG TPA: (2Fe-2S)-binding protein [Acidimicrobiia bacterium]
MKHTAVSFRLGEREIEVLVEPLTTLQSVLRDQLGYMATKDGCRQGGCGSCTVLVDGEPYLSCILPVEDVIDRRIDTVETQTPVDGLNPIQQALLDHNGLQCGYCTPGFVMITTALLERQPHPDRDEIIEAIGGNYCRCTGYRPILDAISAVAGPISEEAQ